MLEILLGSSILLIILLAINLWISFRNAKINSTGFVDDLKKTIGIFDNNLNQIGQSIQNDFQRNRAETNTIARDNREEMSHSLQSFSENFSANVRDFNDLQRQKFDELANRQNEQTKNTEQRLEKIRETVEVRLQKLQEDNSQKLEKMRETVDEKLHRTLEFRLSESFKLVSERLEKVQQGLGEMHTLASGVGDLKKVLTNVKTRGVLGEYQLENILEQLLTPDQYLKNVKTKSGSNEFVEFAIKMPGRKDDDHGVLLPLDAKFPIEDYQLLLQAYEQADVNGVESAKKELAKKIKFSARNIRDKYIDPPATTDFAIMFLPIEGLYAEVLRDVGLFETLQREFRVVVTGPTTLSALLNSLQMGFRTLAIEKRSSEVWELLAAIKTEFGKFGDILERTKKKLQEASNVVEVAGVRSRAIARKLQNVQELPAREAAKLLQTGDTEEADYEEESPEKNEEENNV
jgi:DNA recombination protein RmuC